PDGAAEDDEQGSLAGVQPGELSARGFDVRHLEAARLEDVLERAEVLEMHMAHGDGPSGHGARLQHRRPRTGFGVPHVEGRFPDGDLVALEGPELRAAAAHAATG